MSSGSYGILRRFRAGPCRRVRSGVGREGIPADAVAWYDCDPVPFAMDYLLRRWLVIGDQGERAMAKQPARTDCARDGALTTARILLEIQAINFRP